MRSKGVVMLAAAAFVVTFLPLAASAKAASPLKGVRVKGTDTVAQADILKIPLADFNLGYGKDADGDGISDEAQHALGLGPATAMDKSSRKKNLLKGMKPDGSGKLPTDRKFVSDKKGKLLREDVGGATYEWFVSSLGKAYFLGNAAMNAGFMKTVGLVIPVRPAVDCGTVGLDATADSAPIKCMDAHLKKCEPAKMKTDIFFLVSLSDEYKIVGYQGTSCGVQITQLRHPDPTVVGKKMTCAYDPGKGFYDQLQSDDTSKCSGPLKEAMQNSDVSNTSSSGGAKSIAFSHVAGGVYVGRKRKSEQPVTTKATLDAVWPELFPDEATRPAEPVVDFAKDALEVVYGDRNDYAVKVKGISGGSLNLVLQSQSDSCATAFSQPFEVVRYAKADAGSVNGYFATSNRVDKCRPATPDVGTDVYEDATYGIKIKLPDAVKYFDVKHVAAADATQYATIDFTQHSASKDKDVLMFRIYVVPNDKWPDIEKKGGISSQVGSGFSFDGVKKLGASGANTFAQGGGEFDLPDDVGDYSFAKLEFVQ